MSEVWCCFSDPAHMLVVLSNHICSPVVCDCSRPFHVHVLCHALVLQGGWLFETKWWLPLQLLTFFLAVFGSVRHQVRAAVGMGKQAAGSKQQVVGSKQHPMAPLAHPKALASSSSLLKGGLPEGGCPYSVCGCLCAARNGLHSLGCVRVWAPSCQRV